jgi:hypothetical protein
MRTFASIRRETRYFGKITGFWKSRLRCSCDFQGKERREGARRHVPSHIGCSVNGNKHSVTWGVKMSERRERRLYIHTSGGWCWRIEKKSPNDFTWSLPLTFRKLSRYDHSRNSRHIRDLRNPSTHVQNFWDFAVERRSSSIALSWTFERALIVGWRYHFSRIRTTWNLTYWFFRDCEIARGLGVDDRSKEAVFIYTLRDWLGQEWDRGVRIRFESFVESSACANWSCRR